MTSLRSFLVVLAGLFLAVLAGAMPAAAHPHVFVQARATVVYDDQGQVVAIDHVWQFDDAFSVYALQGLDTDGDGKFSREELQELAKINIDSLKDFGFFTFGDDTRVEIDFKEPTADYWLEAKKVEYLSYWAISDEDRQAIAEEKEKGGEVPQEVTLLELHFTLPLKEPVGHDKAVTFDVYDPTYYVDFRFADGADAVTLRNSPGKCRVETKAPEPLDDETAARLATIGPEVRDLPPELMEKTKNLVNQMIITCGDAAVAAATTGEAEAPTSALDAVNALAAKGDEAAKKVTTTRITASTEEVKDPEAAKPWSFSGGWFSGILGRISQMQSAFYKKMVSALRLFKTDDKAAWLLFFLSFAYGVFHAAGPGHGKAVITSYMFANEATVKRGVGLALAAAFVQGLTAVAIVTVIALFLHGTSIAMQSTLGLFESGSFLLVALLGAWLTWTKGRSLVRMMFGGSAHDHGHDHYHSGHDHNDGSHKHEHGSHMDAHSHDDHVYGPDCGCGHSHLPDAELASKKLSLKEAAAAVLSIGMRPCSGALVVLVFALSLDLYWVGVASAFVMALGTAITVSTLAIIAVTSKGLAQRLLGVESGRARYFTAGLEVVAAVFVLVIGTLLFVASFGATTPI